MLLHWPQISGFYFRAFFDTFLIHYRRNLPISLVLFWASLQLGYALLEYTVSEPLLLSLVTLDGITINIPGRGSKSLEIGQETNQQDTN